MLEKIKNFYDEEFKELKYVLDKNFIWTTPYMVKHNILQRMTGVMLFVQDDNLDFEDVKKLYNEYKEKIEAL